MRFAFFAPALKSCAKRINMTLTPHLRLAASILLGSSCLAGAQAVKLDGTVVDAGGKPLPGIVVQLDGLGLIDTTDANGHWELQAQTTKLRSRFPPSSLRWTGRQFVVNLAAPAMVGFDAYDARGVRIGGVAPARLSAGMHALGSGSPSAAEGIRWLRASIDGKSQVVSAGLATRAASRPGAIASARTLSDSTSLLIYSFRGQEICSTPLASLVLGSLVQSLRATQVLARAIPDSSVRPDSALLRIVGDAATGMHRVYLRFDPRDSSCHGVLYSPVVPGSSAKQLRAWIDILGNGGGRVGISDTTRFQSDADTLRFELPFGIGNAIPRGWIIADSLWVVNTDYLLGFALSPCLLRIRQIEWDVGDGSGFLPGDSTRTVRFREGVDTRICVRVTDEDGGQTIFVFPISVVDRDSIPPLQDRTAVAGQGIVMSLDVFDRDGVRMTIFDYGDGTRDTTTSAPYANVYHVYSMLHTDSGVATRVYTLTATVIDGKGQATTRTAKVTVSNPRAAVVVMNTVGEAGTPLTLHASLLDTETIARVEWSVAGSGFRQGRADTTIDLPAQPTLDHTVLVRVTNTKGYQYAIDTVHVRALLATRITDARDGRQYRIVTIGTQTWMAQNLNYRRSIGGSDTVGVCDERDTSDCSRYGRLYTWAQVMGIDTSYNRKVWTSATARHQGICPQGWHVPSAAEWAKLIEVVGGVQVGGGKLKSSWGWNDDCKCGIGTDDYWFSAYPSTRYRIDDRILDFGEGAYWWTTSQETDPAFGGYVTDFRTFYMDPIITYSATEKSGLESLRCIRD